MTQLKKFISLVIVTLCTCSYSWCQSKVNDSIPLTGVVTQSDSVLISINDIKVANAKMIELKYEKGFDEPTYMYYNNDGKIFSSYDFCKDYIVARFNNIQCDEIECAAPTLQMALKWLREVHNIFIQVDYIWSSKKLYTYTFDIHDMKNARLIFSTPYGESFNTYEEVAEAKYKLCKYIIDKINTIEVKEVDFEKEYKEFVEDDLVYSRLVNNIVGKAIAKHFFELGVNIQQNISINVTAIDKVMEENGVDPNSKEAKMFTESYYIALEKLKAQKGE